MVGVDAKRPESFLGALLATRAHRASVADTLERARRLLADVGLSGRGDHLARHLPYGDQRRLEIARAMAIEPALLLLDEPAAGMNPVESHAMLDLIRTLRDRHGLTILLIEHQMPRRHGHLRAHHRA